MNAQSELAEDMPPVPPSRWTAAIADLVWGLYEWRIWWVLAASEIRQRYRRSTVGQLWFTLSMAAMIAGIGLVYSVIFDKPVSDYVPFLGVGLIVWNLLSGLINDLATCFISAETHLRSYPSPRSTIIYRTIARDFLVSAHNFLIVPVLLILFNIPVSLVLLARNSGPYLWLPSMRFGSGCCSGLSAPAIVIFRKSSRPSPSWRSSLRQYCTGRRNLRTVCGSLRISIHSRASSRSCARRSSAGARRVSLPFRSGLYRGWLGCCASVLCPLSRPHRLLALGGR